MKRMMTDVRDHDDLFDSVTGRGPRRSPGRRAKQGTLCVVVVVLFSTFLLGCDTGPAETLFDPDRPFRPDPVISAVEPSNSSLAGVGTITIMGENFSPNPEENLVYFGNRRVTVVEASETQLTVQPPPEPGENLDLRVNVIGAEQFSNTTDYTLLAAVEEFGGVGDFEESSAIVTDEEGNVYVSMFASNASAGIQRISPDGTREPYIDTPFRWDALQVGDDGTVYGVRNVRAIFRFAPGGGAQEVWAVAPNTADRFVAMAQDEAFIWVAGFGGSIYRVDAGGVLENFSVEGDVRALVIHEDFLYAATTQNGTSSVVRFPVDNGELGASETFFDVTEFAGPGVEALSLAATEEGALFVGTDGDDPLMLVEPDGSGDVFYPGLMDPPAFSLAWGEGSTLYMSRTDVVGMPSRIIKINTQREGS
jgi:hypothetical protein